MGGEGVGEWSQAGNFVSSSFRPPFSPRPTLSSFDETAVATLEQKETNVK